MMSKQTLYAALRIKTRATLLPSANMSSHPCESHSGSRGGQLAERRRSSCCRVSFLQTAQIIGGRTAVSEILFLGGSNTIGSTLTPEASWDCWGCQHGSSAAGNSDFPSKICIKGNKPLVQETKNIRRMKFE